MLNNVDIKACQRKHGLCLCVKKFLQRFWLATTQPSQVSSTIQELSLDDLWGETHDELTNLTEDDIKNMAKEGLNFMVDKVFSQKQILSHSIRIKQNDKFEEKGMKLVSEPLMMRMTSSLLRLNDSCRLKWYHKACFKINKL